jgi:hypothetical protein
MTDEELGSPEIEPDVIIALARAANEIAMAARLTQWGFVEYHCANALEDVKLAIAACVPER